MGLKEDADFSRFVLMGAVATNAVRNDLRHVGHEAIELERYAMANKIWQTKVKRLRLPDLLCVRCGLRIESRGKTKLGIVLSHSDAAGRGWDGGGMRDNDLYAILRVDTADDVAHTSSPVYFRTADLRASRSMAKESNRKAISEGAEVTLTWPYWVPTKSGSFYDADAENRLVCVWDDGGRFRYYHWRNWPARHLYLKAGGPIIAGETMVAGVVAPPGSIACAGGWDPGTALADPDPAERYAAVKAAGVLVRDDLRDVLEQMSHDESDWRLKLEVTASLARMDAGWAAPIADMAMMPTNGDEHRIESVFVLSEIPTNQAAEALAEIAAPDPTKPLELRAAAVWGLARGAQPRPDLVLPFTVDDDDLVALHAIAGMPLLPAEVASQLLDWLDADDRRAAAAAQLLLRHQAVEPLLQAVHRGGRGRLWALRALGDLPPELVRHHAGELLTPAMADALQPIWVGRDDWLRQGGAEGLEALDVQKIRFNPLIEQ